MHSTPQLRSFGLLACALLCACTPAANRYASDAPAARGGAPAIIDNDSYYSQPGSYVPGGQPQYNGCNQINDAPSCGGG